MSIYRYTLFCVVFFCTCFFGAAIAHADVIGQSSMFRTNPEYDSYSASLISATLRAVGQRAYFYVDERYWNGLDVVKQSEFSSLINGLAHQFDNIIYPKMTEFFGRENTPGIDNDEHVYILLEDIAFGNGGYFQTINNYPKNLAPSSNGHEMFYVSARSVWSGTAQRFMAHEFQHLISFYQKELLNGISDDVWVNEARSEYSLTVVGYDTPYNGSALQQRMAVFMRSPSDSLVEWPNTQDDYAVTSAFIHYLANQKGPSAVSAIKYPDSTFSDWMVAAILNDRTIDPKYGYTSDGLTSLHVSPTAQIQIGSDGTNTFSTTLKDWQPFWLNADFLTNVSGTSVFIHGVGLSGSLLHGAIIAKYEGGSARVIPMTNGSSGTIDGIVPTTLNGLVIKSIVVAFTHGLFQQVGNRTIFAHPITITITSGANQVPTQTILTNGDLIRHGTEPEIYVVWGPYRRYMPEGILKLYGFENKPIISVTDDVFAKYTTSNYIRSINDEKVYAVWPDGTRHWLDITPARWDASGRDWGAIFIVNDSEVAWYTTGKNIVQ